MKNNKIELSAQNLSAGYDGKTIVSDVNITIPQNKISVILGANGCGKSTLLKTFADARTSSAVTNRARRD